MSTSVVLAVIRQHSDSVPALRIVFSLLLAIVFFRGLYIFRIRKRLFDRDPEVTGDHYGARNLRLLAGHSRLDPGHGSSSDHGADQALMTSELTRCLTTKHRRS
jgi:hypothetical protein